MAHSSWGPGWPVDRRSEMRQVRARLSGTTLLVHWRLAPIVQFLLDDIESYGHLFDYGPRDVNDDWGYAGRYIAGTRIPSNHSRGTAFDLDAQEYPQGQNKRKPPQWLLDKFAMFKFGNGVGWANPDPMHFEFWGSTADADWITAALAAEHLKRVTQPEAAKELPVRQTVTYGDKGRLVEILNWELCVICKENFVGESDSFELETSTRLGRMKKWFDNDWSTSSVDTEQWRDIDFLYLKAGYDPVVK